jgi:microcystin-dependent protein
MAQPFIGEIRMFGGNFAPNGWALCQGQLVPISENEVLFNLIGTTYGGDGQETFALPDLQSRVPVHMGQGGGLSNYVIGQSGGVETVLLSTQQIPQHNHLLSAATSGQVVAPTAATILAKATSSQPGIMPYAAGPPDGTVLQAASVVNTGGSQPHENLQPILVVNFIISLFGIFPSQN